MESSSVKRLLRFISQSKLFPLGVAIFIVPPQTINDPRKFVDLLHNFKVQRLILLPTQLVNILEYLSLQNKDLLSNLKTWICGGETLTTAIAEKFFKHFDDGTYRLCNVYGCTELAGYVTYYVCESITEFANSRNVPIGQPIDNTIVSIMNDSLHPVRSGDVGEICVAGLCLAKGFVGGRQAAKFVQSRFSDNMSK